MPDRHVYAVHVNGELVTAPILRAHGHDDLACLPDGRAVYRNGSSALLWADRMRELFPQDRVSIELLAPEAAA